MKRWLGGAPEATVPGEGATAATGDGADLWWLLFGALLLVTLRPFVDPDLGGHLAYGLEHLRTGHLPRVDPYSYTAMGRSWVNHEWAFEWMLGLVYSIAGPVGLSLLPVILWGLAGGLLLGHAKRIGAGAVATGLLFIPFVATLPGSMGTRPQLATYLLFAILLLLLEGVRGGRDRWLLAMPPLFAIWVNVHGGFVAGLGVLGVFAAGMAGELLVRRSRDGAETDSLRTKGVTAAGSRRALQVMASVGAAVLATLANPYGIGLWRWMRRSLGEPRAQITEWLPIGMNPIGLMFVATLVLVSISLLRRRDGRTPLAHWLVLMVTAYLAVVHVRHIPFFTMSALVFAPEALASCLRRGSRPARVPVTQLQRIVLRTAMILMLVPFAILQTGWPPGRRMRLDLSDADRTAPYPTGAFEYIERHGVEGNMVVFFDWAQMVILRYHPDILVAYDGRFRTVYPDEIERAYIDLFSAARPAGWRRLLEDWPTGWVLTHSSDDLSERLRAEPAWWLVYEDDYCALFRRSVPGTERPPVERREGAGPVLAFRAAGSAPARLITSGRTRPESVLR